MPLVPHTLSKQASKQERERESVCVWGRVRVNTVSASTIFHTASSPQNAVDAVSGACSGQPLKDVLACCGLKYIVIRMPLPPMRAPYRHRFPGLLDAANVGAGFLQQHALVL